MSLPTPWALAGPGEKFKVLADGGQLYPLIIWPHNVLEMSSFLHVVGNMSGHPRQETIFLGYGYPGQGEEQSQKLRGFFARAKSLRGASQPDPLCATQTVTCLEWPHISPTLLQKQLRDSPSIQGVERGFVQGGLCPFSVIARYPAGKCCQISGGSPWPDQQWDLDVLFRDCCPILSLSGPAN